MAATKSKKFLAPKFLSPEGFASYQVDEAVLAAAALNDTVDFHLPAGYDLSSLAFQWDDIDSNGAPLVTYKAGYTPLDPGSALAPSLQYFMVASNTPRTGGRDVCAFKPLKFEEDVIVRITFTAAAATFAAGSVHMIAGGNSVGVK